MRRDDVGEAPRLDPLTFRVLLVLQEGVADGNSILERLRDLEERSVPSLPTLYRCLRSLLDRGWLEVARTEDDGTPGRPRQIYRLSSDGVEAVRREGRRLRELSDLALREEPATGSATE